MCKTDVQIILGGHFFSLHRHQIVILLVKQKMTTILNLDSGPRFNHEDGERKRPPPSRCDVKPQYVHHVAPKPPPEISQSIPKGKDVKKRCVKFTVAAVISLLLLLLLAGILLAYYYSSPCVHGRQCGDGSCVWESQWCDGVMDCPAGQDEAECVRLHGSSFLLQIYSSNNWRSVCSHGWTEQQGRAGCQHLGYSRGTYFKSGQQQTDSDDGFLTVKSDLSPGASILRQLVLSNTCPNNSVVTLRCTDESRFTLSTRDRRQRVRRHCGERHATCNIIQHDRFGGGSVMVWGGTSLEGRTDLHVIASDCGIGVNSSRASGGQLASLGAWPWQVSLQLAGSHRCGGAIISPYWTITAAHCVARASSPGAWTVYAGIVDPSDTLFNPAYSVSRIIAHAGYDSVTHRNDIALMRLSKPLDFAASSNIGPVCLPNVGLNITSPQTGWITQFGHTGNGDSGSLYLMEAQVSLIDTADCNSSIAHNGRISQDMLCATETEAVANKCHTDSGGPLVSLKDGVWWLIGDSIWGDRCTEQNKPGVYGNVTYFLDWIYHQMRKHRDD